MAILGAVRPGEPVQLILAPCVVVASWARARRVASSQNVNALDPLPGPQHYLEQSPFTGLGPLFCLPLRGFR